MALTGCVWGGRLFHSPQVANAIGFYCGVHRPVSSPSRFSGLRSGSEWEGGNHRGITRWSSASEYMLRVSVSQRVGGTHTSLGYRRWFWVVPGLCYDLPFKVTLFTHTLWRKEFASSRQGWQRGIWLQDCWQWWLFLLMERPGGRRLCLSPQSGSEMRGGLPYLSWWMEAGREHHAACLLWVWYWRRCCSWTHGKHYPRG